MSEDKRSDIVSYINSALTNMPENTFNMNDDAKELLKLKQSQQLFQVLCFSGPKMLPLYIVGLPQTIILTVD